MALEYTELPTPDVPSRRMMADFLVTYGRMLQRVTGPGESVAAAGFNVLERVRAGVVSRIDQSKQTADWEVTEPELAACLLELQRDINIIRRYKNEQPGRVAVELASLRCIEAARLLRRL